MGPYAGLALELSPQVLEARMQVFYRAYEPEVTAWLHAVVRPGMVAFDVGAHVGIHALYLGQLVGQTGQVVAFEAWPGNFLRLQKNIALNPKLVGRIIPISKAVGPRDGIASFTEGQTDGTHHLTGHDELSTLEVPVTTLDSFWTESGYSPHLIMVDVEGAESAVMEGAQRLLLECRPHLILEHHGPDRRERLTQRLARLGYNVQPIGLRHLAAVWT